MEQKWKIETTSTTLHMMGMVFMLCDHMWGTVIPGNDWLNCVGRVAFPIFAFLLVEGYVHTRSLKKYALRLLVFAAISEIPFNLAMGSSWFYPVHQNVLWSFLIALGLIHWIERTKHRVFWIRATVMAAAVALGAILGLVTMVDFYHAGILTVLVFYFFRGRKWWDFAAQLIGLWYINTEILGGLVYEFSILGMTLTLHRQAFALLALIPIWLYRGRKGMHGKWFQYLCYWFYPLHLLILGLLKTL